MASFYRLKSYLSCFFILTFFSLLSCGYQLVGKGTELPSHCQQVAIDIFENKTFEPGLETILAQALLEEFSQRAGVSIVSKAKAGSLLRGQILSYSSDPQVIGANGVAQQYRVTITAKVVFKDIKNNEIIWEDEQIQFSEVYDLQADIMDSDAAKKETQAKICKDFAQMISSAIFEGF